MSLTDIRGVPVSTTNRASLEKYERAADLFLGYFNDPFATIDFGASGRSRVHHGPLPARGVDRLRH